MAELQDDVQHMGDEYMVDFEDDAEVLLQAGERNLLDTDSDDNDVVRTTALLITELKITLLLMSVVFYLKCDSI